MKKPPVSRKASQAKRPSRPFSSAVSTGPTACETTSQKRNIKMPVAVEARKAFVAGLTLSILPIGRPRKMVSPAIAPSARVWAVLM